MIKKVFILITLLLLCNACVSRTPTSTNIHTGMKKEMPSDKKLIWFWQDEFSQ
jgi:hypothetical protein